MSDTACHVTCFTNGALFTKESVKRNSLKQNYGRMGEAQYLYESTRSQLSM